MHWAWISLNIGAMLFVSCITVMLVSHENLDLVEQNQVLTDVSLNDTNNSIKHRFNISDINEPFSIAVYSGPTYYRDLGDVDLKATVSASNEQVLFEKEFTNSFYSTIQFNKTGDYTFSVSRISDEYEVKLSALIGHFPSDSYYYNHIAMISWLFLLFMAMISGGMGMIATTVIWVKKATIRIKKRKT